MMGQISYCYMTANPISLERNQFNQRRKSRWNFEEILHGCSPPGDWKEPGGSSCSHRHCIPSPTTATTATAAENGRLLPGEKLCVRERLGSQIYLFSYQLYLFMLQNIFVRLSIILVKIAKYICALKKTIVWVGIKISSSEKQPS